MATRRDRGALRRFGIAHVIGAVVVTGVVIAGAALEIAKDRNANIATAKAWDIQGPPCPTLTPAQWTAAHQAAPKSFDFDGTTLARWSGDASCADVHDKGGKGFGVDKVCQFANPLVIRVTSPAGTFYFNPGIAQPATVTIHKNVPRCVMASKFTLQTE
jgi:hypothetical protein